LIQEGEDLGHVGRHKEALLKFNQAIAMDPSDHMAWFNRGVVSETIGDPEDARKAFTICLQNTPEHGPAAANLAVLLDRLGEAEEAAKWAVHAIASFPAHPLLSEIARKGGAPTAVATTAVAETTVGSAQAEQEQIVGQTPEPVDASEPDHELQQSPTDEMAEVADIDLEALAEQAANLVREGNAESAIELLRPHLPEAAAEHARCWRVAAGALARLNLNQNAIESFSYALDLENEDSPSWFNLGSLHKRDGNLEAAVTCFETAVGLNPAYVKAAQALAVTKLDLGDVEGSINAYRLMFEADPDHPDKIQYAEMLLEIGEGEGRVIELVPTLPPTLPEGPELAAEALALLPDSDERTIQILRARAHTLRSEHVESVTLWRGLLESDREDIEMWVGLAKALEAAGDAETARKCRDKIRTLGGVVGAQPIEVDAQMNKLLSTPPEAVQKEPVESVPDPVVDLAKAALDAQQAASSDVPISVDSTSVANQDVEWYNRGIGLMGDKKYKESLSCFKRALPAFAHDDEMAIRILNGMGNALYFLEQYAECIESYHQAMAINPAAVSGATLYNMGTAYAEVERYDDAIKCFEQAGPRGLDKEQQKMAKEQISRCGKLRKQLRARLKAAA
jgi:tetratricopeptide (TPR) repeat protein